MDLAALRQRRLRIWSDAADRWEHTVSEATAEAGARLRAFGFVLDQTGAIKKYGWEKRFVPGEFDNFHVSLRDIEQVTRLEFAQSLHDADAKKPTPNESGGEWQLVQSLDDVTALLGS